MPYLAGIGPEFGKIPAGDGLMVIESKMIQRASGRKSII